MKSLKIHHKQIRTPSKDCFFLYLELKSIEKVCKHLASVGDINPNTGKPFGDNAVSDYIFRWVIENSDEARPLIEEKFYGDKIPQEVWDRYLIKTAMRVYDTDWNRQKDWIIRHDMEKYKDAWDKHSPTGTLD